MPLTERVYTAAQAAAPEARGAPVIEVRGLRKDYYGQPVIDGVDLSVQRGEVFAILGPNGAGKTTTVEILEGFRKRTAGEVTVLGEDPATAGRHWRARIGVVPQDTGSFDELTVREIVRSFACFYPAPLPADEVIELVGLAGKAGSRARTLSGGQQRRLDVALGIIGDPELVFLDEPTTGLDPQARRQAWELIRRLTARGATVVLTTHYLDEVEALANRVAVLVGGQIAEVNDPRRLGGRAHGLAVISFRREGPLAERKLPGLDGDGAVDEADGLVHVSTAVPAAALRKLIDWCWTSDMVELPELEVSRPSLEDTYLKMIGSRLSGQDPK
jgi:ABC-2 type transport system ATP-binding protein